MSRQRCLVRAAGLAGMAASLAYAVGDVLLFGHEPESARHPELADLSTAHTPVLSTFGSKTRPACG